MLRSLSKSSVRCFTTRNLYCSFAVFSAQNLSVNRKLSPFAGIKVRAVFTIRSKSVPVSFSMAGDHMTSNTEVQQIKILTAINDDHGGVIVELNERMDSNLFVSILKASISQWRQQGKRGVWIKVPIELVNLVEAAIKEGFWYHHAESNYLMLVYWIPEGANTLPANATHRVGIGAFVMNEKREVFPIQFCHTLSWIKHQPNLLVKCCYFTGRRLISTQTVIGRNTSSLILEAKETCVKPLAFVGHLYRGAHLLKSPSCN